MNLVVCFYGCFTTIQLQAVRLQNFEKTYIFLKLGRNSIFKSGLLNRAKAKKVCSFGRLKSAVTTPEASVQV